MNGNNRFYGRAGLWASSTLLGVLTGCTTYIQAPRPAPVYVVPPPPVEATDVVVTTPPLEPPMPVQTVLEIRTTDSIGLLCRLTAALERCQLDVRSARVSSGARSS